MNEDEKRKEIALKAIDTLREAVAKSTVEGFSCEHIPYDDYGGECKAYALHIAIREPKPDGSVPQAK
jgi:hypothetical protein